MKRLKAILASGWGRLGLVSWVLWVGWTFADIDSRRSYYWRDDDYLEFVARALVVPVVVLLVAWWVRLGFLSPEERARRRAAPKQATPASSGAQDLVQVREFAEKRTEFEHLIKATGVRKTVADDLEASTDCLLCGTRFFFVSGKIELIEKNGQRGFVCRECADKVNQARLYFGLGPLEILPGTYVDKAVKV
jgi:hypothetical protein